MLDLQVKVTKDQAHVVPSSYDTQDGNMQSVDGNDNPTDMQSVDGNDNPTDDVASSIIVVVTKSLRSR